MCILYTSTLYDYTQKPFKITTIINLENNYLLYTVCVIWKLEILSTPFQTFAAGGIV